MHSLTSFVTRYPLATFFGLTLILSWITWPTLGDQNPTGPLLAALIVVPIIGGRAGLIAWLSRIWRWRVGLRWYAAALFLPLIIVVTAVYLNVLLGAPAPTAAQLGVWPELLPEFVIVFLFVGLGEEPGFRGFALPRLQAGRSALSATLLLAAFGMLWHLPIFLAGDAPWSNVLLIVAGYVLFTWLFNNTDGSVLIAALFHSAVAVVGPSYFATMFSGPDFARYSWLLTLLYCLAAVVVIAWAGPARLSRRSLEQLGRIVEPMPGP